MYLMGSGAFRRPTRPERLRAASRGAAGVRLKAGSRRSGRSRCARATTRSWWRSIASRPPRSASLSARGRSSGTHMIHSGIRNKRQCDVRSETQRDRGPVRTEQQPRCGPPVTHRIVRVEAVDGSAAQRVHEVIHRRLVLPRQPRGGEGDDRGIAEGGRARVVGLQRRQNSRVLRRLAAAAVTA